MRLINLLFTLPGLRLPPLRRAGVQMARQLTSDLSASAGGAGFEGMGLSPPLRAAVHAAGFQAPTHVQSTSFDVILGGDDVVLLSETGSGKTLAYALPILHRLLEHRASMGENGGGDEGDGALGTGAARRENRVLVLVPTQDLCTQVLDTFTTLLDGMGDESERGAGLAPLTVSTADGQAASDVDTDVLIGTPARVLRLWRGPEAYRTVVLDEADALLAGSFKQAARSTYPIEQLIAAVKRSAKLETLAAGAPSPPRGALSGREARAALQATKQFVLVGATMPNAGTKNMQEHVTRLFPLAKWCRTDRLHRDRAELRQYFVLVGDENRGDAFRSALKHGPRGPTLVFANTLADAEEAHEEAVRYSGPAGVEIFHKELPPPARARVLARFNSGETSTLVCTGLASRGIDFVDVAHVVQYTVATNAVEFMHRVGRTARAGKPGVATTLYTEDRAELVEGLRNALAAGGPIEHLFSRKRSLVLGIKKRRRRAEEQRRAGRRSY